MHVVAYIVSGAADPAAGGDTTEQRSQMERWAARRKAVVRGWYEDREVGAGPLFKARPALMEALSALRDGDAEALLLTTRDLLDAHEQAMAQALARRAGARGVEVGAPGPPPAV